MTDAGGTLINRGVRNRVLAEFIFKKRRQFVKVLTARLLNKGLKANISSSSNPNDYDDEESDQKIISGFHVTEAQARAFLLQSESKEDLLAAEMGRVVQQVDQAKKDYIAQKKVRQNNLTCQTTWVSFLRDITVRDMTHMFIKMVEISAQEKAARETLAAGQMRADAQKSDKPSSERDSSMNSAEYHISVEDANVEAKATIEEGDSGQGEVRSPQPVRPSEPKPSGQGRNIVVQS